MLFVDTHCHLGDRRFESDQPAVVDRATQAGVRQLITLGVDLASSRQVIELAERHPAVYAAIGFHPHEAEAFRPSDESTLAELSGHPKVVAIGEIGLDFYRDYAPRATQIAVFRRQLDLAVELDRPVAIHDRSAHGEIAEELRAWTRRHRRRPSPAGVMHCFSGNRELAEACVDWGLLVSFAGPLTYPKNGELADVARGLDLDHIVVETDAPYLPPQERRGSRNEPTGVIAVAQRLAELRGDPLDEIAGRTTANASRLFRLPEPEPLPAIENGG